MVLVFEWETLERSSTLCLPLVGVILLEHESLDVIDVHSRAEVCQEECTRRAANVDEALSSLFRAQVILMITMFVVSEREANGAGEGTGGSTV